MNWDTLTLRILCVALFHLIAYEPIRSILHGIGSFSIMIGLTLCFIRPGDKIAERKETA